MNGEMQQRRGTKTGEAEYRFKGRHKVKEAGRAQEGEMQGENGEMH